MGAAEGAATTGPASPGDQRLAGKRVILTGAAGGIGGAIAEHLARCGARLALLDRRLVGLDDLARGLAGAGHSVHAVDLADPARTREATAAAVSALGGLDGLVNNAGVFEKVALADITVEAWDSMIAVNARAPLVLMQSALPALTLSGAGRIVNIASMGARLAAPLEGHYAASKAALLALTRAAAVEWGPRAITVNAISPGYVLTELGAGARSASDIESWTRRSPLGRLAEPLDVAVAVAFLLGPHAAYLTGQTLEVTGGMTMY
jgi:NAD(P)-dependent dehydrogenase (short-subunit alcohol dehydrogenase family)